ncbi:hypothetical protein [Streptomyces sp. NPDC001889]
MPVEDPRGQFAQWLDRSRQRRVGDESWAYRSFADLVAEHGSFFSPAPWPAAEAHPKAGGRCFAAASEWSDRTGWTYAEGYAIVPSEVDPFPVFEHAWCLTGEGEVADPALPDGMATGYFGIPVSERFRREQQHSRATKAVFTQDPSNPLAGVNKLIFRTGLPRHALATGAVRIRRGSETFPRL